MASGSAGSIYVDLLLRDAAYISGLQSSSRKTKTFAGALANSFKGILPDLGAVSGALAAAFSFNKLIQNTINFQNEQAQLAAVLKSTGNAAGYTQRQLNAMAESLSAKSIFSAGEINKAQTRLLSYAGVLGENIPRAMQAVIDQSSRLGINVEQSAETIGRALEQPSKAAAALSRQGFGSYFTKEVVETLKSLEEQGDMVSAQIKILEVLEESYAGAAVAARDTLGGALKNLNNTLNDILTEEGGFDSASKVINGFSDFLRQAAKDSNLLETALYGLYASTLELSAKMNEFGARSAERWNFFGINDDLIEKRIQRAKELRDRQEELGRDLLSRKDTPEIVDFSQPSLPTNPYIPSRDVEEGLKAIERLDSIYKKYEESIRGVGREVIQLEAAERDLSILRDSGRISQEQMTLALERYKESLNQTSGELDNFSKKAAENIQDAFADFLFDPFDEGLKGMAKGFVDTIRKMIAEAQAAQLAKWLFGDMVGGTGDGMLGDIFGKLGGIFGLGNKSASNSINWGSFLPGFADGGFLGAGKWGIMGEEGPELIYGGNTGKTIIPLDGRSQGNVYNIDARGADQGAVRRIEAALQTLAGPGVTERRVLNAQVRGSL